MIQLHLQGTTEPGPRAVVVPGFEMPYLTMIAILITMVLAVGFKAAYGHRVDDHAWGMASKMEIAKRHSRELALYNVRTSVNGTGALWLKSISDRGEDVVIEGMAVSPEALDEMISNLRSTGYFRRIEIKETYQDDSRNKTKAFNFEAICQVGKNEP